MLKLDKVSFCYGEKQIFRDFSFFAEEGETTAILGASGSGKSTLMGIASGLLKCDSGEVTQFSYRKSGFLFQEDRLLPWETIIGNITVTGVSKERAAEYIERLGLSEYSEKYPSELSGGMARRLAIARALAFGEDLFFLDEPMRGLDVKTAEDVLNFMKECLWGETALIITHDPHEAYSLADRIVVLGKRPVQILGDFRRDNFRNEEDFSSQLKKII